LSGPVDKFPNAAIRFVTPDGTITRDWLDLLFVLWRRTGEAPGIFLADVQVQQAGVDILITDTLNFASPGFVVNNSPSGVAQITFTETVTSVFGRTGAVVAQDGDYSLDMLGDVVLTSPTLHDLLQFDGTDWINVTPSVALDNAFSNVQGSILYRNATEWVALAPGSDKYRLKTQGAAANPAWVPQPYVLAFSCPNGTMTASQIVGMHRLGADITFQADFGSIGEFNSEAGGSANATASTTLTVAKAPTATPNTFSTIGTIVIGAGSVTPTFATVGNVAVDSSKGDVIKITGPVSPDATYSDPYVTLAAQIR